MRSTVSRPCSSSTSATTTLAPSLAKASALLRPIPEAAPVTSATRPSSCPVIAPPGSEGQGEHTLVLIGDHGGGVDGSRAPRSAPDNATRCDPTGGLTKQSNAYLRPEHRP